MKTRVCNILLTFAAVALIAVGIYVVVGATTTVSSPVSVVGTAQEAPRADFKLPLVQLEGKWEVEHNGTKFVANIDGANITIDMVTSDGTRMTYWHGTFVNTESPGQKIVSMAVDNGTIVLSQSTTKEFAISEDSISFDFSAMGATRTMVMHRG